MRNQNLRKIDLAVIEEALHCQPAAIHEREWLEDLDLLLANANLRELALEAALLAETSTVLTRQSVGKPEAGVVTR